MVQFDENAMVEDNLTKLFAVFIPEDIGRVVIAYLNVGCPLDLSFAPSSGIIVNEGEYNPWWVAEYAHDFPGTIIKGSIEFLSDYSCSPPHSPTSPAFSSTLESSSVVKSKPKRNATTDVVIMALEPFRDVFRDTYVISGCEAQFRV